MFHPKKIYSALFLLVLLMFMLFAMEARAQAQQKDVSIRKINDTTIPVGDPAVFALSAQNLGPGPVSSVIVSDTLPAGLTAPITANGGSNWNCSVLLQKITCTYVGPAVNPTALFQPPIIISATAATAGQFTGCATIALNQTGYTDPIPQNDGACKTFEVTAAPRKDVRIKQGGGGLVAAGNTVRFLLTPFNNGPGSVTNVTITDSLPEGVTLSTITQNGWNCPTPISQMITCTYTDAALGWGRRFPPIIIEAVANIPGEFTNCARIVINGVTDSNSEDNEDCRAYNVTDNPKADVSIRKFASAPVFAGSPVTFTLSPFNNGPGSVDSVTVTDILPENLTTITPGGYPWTCSISSGPQTATCRYVGPSIEQSLSFPPITIQATAQTSGEFTSCAEIALGNGVADTNPGNNQDCRSYIVTPSISPAVGITQHGGGTAQVGEPVNFRLAPFNSGPGAVSSVTVTNTGLAGLTAVTATGAYWNCPSPGAWMGTCSYTGPSVQPGGFFPTISIAATAQTVGQFTNCVTITLIAAPDSGNNNRDCRPYEVKPVTTGTITIKVAAQRWIWTGSGFNIEQDDPQDFTFTTAGNLLSPFDLDDDGDNTNTLSDSKTLTVMSGIDYIVTMKRVSRWHMEGVCLGSQFGVSRASVDWPNQTFTVNLNAGGQYRCDFNIGQDVPMPGSVGPGVKPPTYP